MLKIFVSLFFIVLVLGQSPYAAPLTKSCERVLQKFPIVSEQIPLEPNWWQRYLAFSEEVAARMKSANWEVLVSGPLMASQIDFPGSLVGDTVLLIEKSFSKDSIEVRMVAGLITEVCGYQVTLTSLTGERRVNLNHCGALYVYRRAPKNSISSLPLGRRKIYRKEELSRAFKSARADLKAALDPTVWASAGADYEDELGTYLERPQNLSGRDIVAVVKLTDDRQNAAEVAIVRGQVRDIKIDYDDQRTGLPSYKATLRARNNRFTTVELFGAGLIHFKK